MSAVRASYDSAVFCCMDEAHFIHSAFEGHLGFLHFLAVMSHAAVNVHVQALGEHVFISLEYVLRT